jgi:hypothetical protein
MSHRHTTQRTKEIDDVLASNLAQKAKLPRDPGSEPRLVWTGEDLDTFLAEMKYWYAMPRAQRHPPGRHRHARLTPLARQDVCRWLAGAHGAASEGRAPK